MALARTFAGTKYPHLLETTKNFVAWCTVLPAKLCKPQRLNKNAPLQLQSNPDQSSAVQQIFS